MLPYQYFLQVFIIYEAEPRGIEPEGIKDALKKSIEVEYKEHTTIIEQLNIELKNIKTKTYNWNLRCADRKSVV